MEYRLNGGDVICVPCTAPNILCLMTQVVIPSYPYVDILECVLTCFLSLTAHTGCFLRSLKFFLKITFIFR